MLFDSLVIFIVILCVIISVIRGFIKELCAVMLLLLSILLTIDYYDFFTINYSQYFNDIAVVNILSIVSVFIILNLIFMIINNWIMYLLLPIRLNLIDRATGVIIGTLKGFLLSYIMFFVLHVYCHVVYEQSDSPREVILPDFITHSYSYHILFSTADNIIDTYIPESFTLKIKEIREEILDN